LRVAEARRERGSTIAASPTSAWPARTCATPPRSRSPSGPRPASRSGRANEWPWPARSEGPAKRCDRSPPS